MKALVISRGFSVALIATLAILAALPVQAALSAQQQDAQASTKQVAQKSADNASVSDGEKKFKQNCSRCHEAPQELPPHISGTILRHMRVRASLSQQDERDILKFLNPQ